MCATVSAQNAQDYKAFIKERKAVQKLVKQERDEKVSKETKKQAKQFAKEGWKVTVGALPLDKQIEKSILMQYELDMNSGMPKYIQGSGKAISSSYDAAKMQAMADAKTELAGNIQTEVAAIIEERLANQELGKEEAVVVSNAVQVSKQVIVQSIGRVITVVECYRELKNKNEEVQVREATYPPETFFSEFSEGNLRPGESVSELLDRLKSDAKRGAAREPTAMAYSPPSHTPLTDRSRETDDFGTSVEIYGGCSGHGNQ